MLHAGKAVQHQVWNEIVAVCAGIWQQPNISILTKRQGEEGKRISSGRETSLVPVTAFHFSVLPPVNKTVTSGTAPEGF